VVPVGCVVLAAGASTRMGRAKALMPTPDGTGRTFLAAVVECARAAGVSEVMVVLGPPHGDEVRRALPAGARFTLNPAPERGMLTSVQAGVAALVDDIEVALVWPVDVPLVGVGSVRAILAAALGPARPLVIPSYAGRGGHPVAIPRTRFAELLAVPAEQGLRALVAARPAAVTRLALDDAWLVRDFDTPADLAR
jgi:molybdenum cofactor cytidylyltransferase